MRYFLTCLASALIALPASALNVPIQPPGMCSIDSSQPTDRLALNYMHLATQGEAELKALFAQCQEVEHMRASKQDTVSHYGALIVQKTPFAKPIDRATAMQLIGTVSGLSGVISSQAMGEASGILNEDDIKGKSNPSYHRLLKQSDAMVIIGGEQRHASRSLLYGMAAVSAITLIDNQVVIANYYGPAGGPQSYELLVGEAERYLNSVIAANP